MTDKPLYIFDIDGTIALIGHRRHMLDDKNDSYRWRSFYAACDKDEPNLPVIDTMERLRFSGAEIWFFSGRSSEVKGKTIAWLIANTSFIASDFEQDILTMREEGECTPDDALKRRWLDNMLTDDRLRLFAVFDDRDRVVNMWREAGVTCYQVAPGEF